MARHCLQQAVCQNCGITFVGKYLLISPQVARREVLRKPQLRQAADTLGAMPDSVSR